MYTLFRAPTVTNGNCLPVKNSRDQVIIVEVMGRNVGHLALHPGVAGGADVILIPEIPYFVKSICKHINQLRYSFAPARRADR
ncbi:hypothetical protein NUACC21_61010 [Scytonema sp. NUACC21]